MARSTSIPKRSNSNFSNLSDDTEDEEYTSALKDGERLVSCLPSITHFVAILPQIYPFLLQACLVETNLNYLQHYLLFLTQNYPHDKLYESVIGLSRLIVDRYEIIQKILSPSSSRKPCEILNLQGSTSVILLGSLFELFRSAMEAAIHSQTIPQFSSTSDFLLVTFPTKSQKALIHTALTQAIFLLLSLGPPLGTATDDFTYLRDLWVPSQPHSKPEAHTMENKDLVSLPPREVVQYTLLSLNPAVLEASIQIAKPAQLCEHVQRFGCPVACMERVLEVLDDLCSERSVVAELCHCVVDPVLMAMHVEIQMLRGVETGAKFLDFIRGLANLPPVSAKITGKTLLLDKKNKIGISDSLLPISKFAVPKLFTRPQLKRVPQFLQNKSAEEIEQCLLQIFCQYSDPHRSQNAAQIKSLRFQLENDLRLLLRSDGADIDLTSLVTALLKVTSSKKVKVVEGMLQTRFAITLLRMVAQCLLTRQLEHLSDMFRKTINNICKFLESSRYKLTKLKYYHSFKAVLKVSGDKFKCEKCSSQFSADQELVKDIKSCHNPFQMEPAIITVCHEAIQGRNLIQLESLLNFLVKKSLSSNAEDKCIKLLYDIKTTVSSSCAPLAYQSNPKLFAWNDATCTQNDMELEDASSLDLHRGVPDVTGLLVDVLEVLDSDIYHVSTSVSTRFLFGYSETCHGPLKNKRTTLLLSGQGYLLACLVNNSSWNSLLSALGNLLDKSNLKEWYIFKQYYACTINPVLPP